MTNNSSITPEDTKSMQQHFEKFQNQKLNDSNNSAVASLMHLVKELRNKETGCPWDKIQDIKSFSQCIKDEAQEVMESIENNDNQNLKEELGDLFFTILFMINLAEEKQLFSFEDVLQGTLKKLVFRHPHVFGNNPKKDTSPEEAYALFQEAKKIEKANNSK